jgi:hypothetical protein
MLLRVAADLSELVVGAEQAEQENILGADRGVPEPLEVWHGLESRSLLAWPLSSAGCPLSPRAELVEC